MYQNCFKKLILSILILYNASSLKLTLFYKNNIKTINRLLHFYKILKSKEASEESRL